MTQRVTTRQRKALIDKISRLTETEHQEIFKLLQESIKHGNVGHTQNRNGMFIDFKMIPNDVILKIEQFVDFCNYNRQNLDAYDKCINECKLNKDISKVVTLHHSKTDDLLDTKIDTDFDECNTNSLQNVIARAAQSHQNEKQWLDLLKENKQCDKVLQYVDLLENNYSKIHKKKTCNMKYANAKKKYARRAVAEKKIDSDLISVLEPEEYIL